MKTIFKAFPSLNLLWDIYKAGQDQKQKYKISQAFLSKKEVTIIYRK